MIRALAGVALSLALALNCAAAGWALVQHPFAMPLAERSAAELAAALERAMARAATPELVSARFGEALAAGDVDGVILWRDLAEERGIALDPQALAEAEALEARSGGVRDCLACAWDITKCRTIAILAACGLTVAVSPLGDLKALGGAAANWAQGEPVDEVDAGLAVLGLAATGVVVLSGGTSVTVKLGVGAFRTGRKMGAIGAKLTGVLAGIASGLIRWSEVPEAILKRNFDKAVDGAKIASLRRMTDEFGMVYDKTNFGEAMVLLRHVDSAEDLTRLSRVAEAAGTKTRPAFEVLGKARVFRLLDRVAGMVFVTLGLLALLWSQLVSLLVWLAGRLLRRAARRPRRAAAA